MPVLTEKITYQFFSGKTGVKERDMMHLCISHYNTERTYDLTHRVLPQQKCPLYVDAT